MRWSAAAVAAAAQSCFQKLAPLPESKHGVDRRKGKGPNVIMTNDMSLERKRMFPEGYSLE